MAERFPLKEKVGGSNPPGLTKLCSLDPVVFVAGVCVTNPPGPTSKPGVSTYHTPGVCKTPMWVSSTPS